MTPSAQKDQIEEIRLHSDIVEVIGRYVPLKKAGGSRFKGLCPFHKEKTPSFHVDSTKQLFHCFGCGASGDVFSFVMQYENVVFPEAARILADRAGIAFETAGQSDPRSRSDKASLYELHEALAAFYAEALEQHPQAEAARRYLEERDLSDAVKQFQLGYAPPPPKSVVSWAEHRKYPAALLEKAGIVLPNDRGGLPYDRFKDRLMFPIRDEQGRVVAFSGRILNPSSNAKYVNSPETPLFRKSRVLYALDRARQSIVDSRQAILCEGQIDVIRCHIAGCTTAVAPQGTALTEAHALLLKRYADEIVLVFDADTAGQNAALRAAEVLLQEGLTVRIAALPSGEDPDTLIRTQGPEAFQSLIGEANSLVNYHVKILRERGEMETQAGRLRATRALLESIHHAPSAVQREHYLDEASRALGIAMDALRTDLRQMLRPSRAQSYTANSTATPATITHPPQEMALIEIMIAHPEALDLVGQYVSPEAVTDATCRTIIHAILSLPELDETHLMQALSGESEECRRLAARIQMTARTISSEEVSGIQAAQDIVLRLRIGLLEKRIRECSAQLQDCPAAERRHLEDERSNRMVVKKMLEDAFRHHKWDAAASILDLDP